MGTEQKTPASKPDTSAGKPAPVLVDLGKKSSKLVKRLRKGKGKLMDSVAATVQELQAAGQIGANAQPVIIVVTEKSESLYRLWKM